MFCQRDFEVGKRGMFWSMFFRTTFVSACLKQSNDLYRLTTFWCSGSKITTWRSLDSGLKMSVGCLWQHTSSESHLKMISLSFKLVDNFFWKMNWLFGLCLCLSMYSKTRWHPQMSFKNLKSNKSDILFLKITRTSTLIFRKVLDEGSSWQLIN